MNTNKLLRKLDINPEESALLITIEEAISNLVEAIEEYCPNLKIEKMSKGDLKELINSYGDCVVNYHPENYHQERATLLKNFEILKKYGLTDEDYDSLDFS
jgi:hypothetical protein